MAINPNFLAKLKRKGYRETYLRETVTGWIVQQIHALREAKEWTQSKLGDEMGKHQSVVARIENPEYGKWNLGTLLDVAKAFDVALEVRFTDWATFVRQSQSAGANLLVGDFSSTDWAALDGPPVTGGDTKPTDEYLVVVNRKTVTERLTAIDRRLGVNSGSGPRPVAFV